MKVDIDEDIFSRALKAIEKHPKHYLTLFNISLIYLDKAKYEKAHEFLMRAYKIQSTNQQALYNLGFWKQKLKDYTGAIEMYEKVLQKDPNNHKAISHLAICLHYIGETEMGAKLIRKCLESSNPDLKLRMNLAILLMKLNRYEEALDCY